MIINYIKLIISILLLIFLIIELCCKNIKSNFIQINPNDIIDDNDNGLIIINEEGKLEKFPFISKLQNILDDLNDLNYTELINTKNTIDDNIENLKKSIIKNNDVIYLEIENETNPDRRFIGQDTWIDKMFIGRRKENRKKFNIIKENNNNNCSI